MNKYTPGPWIVGRGGIYSSTGKAVTNWPVFHEPQDADAALLAAALELLEALMALVDEFCSHADWRRAREAIKKARGGA